MFDSEPGAVTVPNPNLKAENAYSLDMGFAKVFGEAVKLDVTGYYTVLNNAMVRRNFQLNGMDSIMYDGALNQVQAIQNAAVANVYGLQGRAGGEASGRFSFSSDLNAQRGEENWMTKLKALRHAALLVFRGLPIRPATFTCNSMPPIQASANLKTWPWKSAVKRKSMQRMPAATNFAPRGIHST